MRPTKMLLAAAVAAALFWVGVPTAGAADTNGASVAGTGLDFRAVTIAEISQATPTATPLRRSVLPVQPAPVTPTQEITLSVNAVTILTATATLTPTLAPTAVPDAAYAGPILGTIVANRTTSQVQFFVEGQTYSLDPLRSAGVELARPTAALNLFNCDAGSSQAQLGCFWDPYLLVRDGFYEVVSGKDAGALASLILREAGAPPTNQIWIQNRTGLREEVYFGTQMRELPPAGVEEFPVEGAGVGVFYLRTCVNSDTESVCEWTAHSAKPGTYYALVESSWQTGTPDTVTRSLELVAVLGESSAPVAPTAGETPIAATAPTIAQPAQMVCRLAVPALNVRSGPGLGFEIIKKVRSTEVDIATILVIGRTEDGQWLQLDERSATGGWVIAGPEYLTCDGDSAALPVIGEAELPPTPTPLPVVEVPALDPAAIAPAPVVTPTVEAPTGPVIPAGLALLTVQNAFDRDIRFTLDQLYRVELGPSEIDLVPGASATFLVYPGQIPYTVSSGWQGLSGNANVVLEKDQAGALYLYFIYDGVEDRWLLQWQ